MNLADYRVAIALLVSLLLACMPLNAQMQLNGDAVDLGSNCFQLSNTSNSQVSSIFAPVDLSDGFTYVGDVFLGCNDSGADGMTFVFQGQSQSAVGIEGGGMAIGGVSPSLIVELDTYQNAVIENDPAFDHIALQQDGNMNHNSSLVPPVPISTFIDNVENCEPHHLAVEWDPVSMTLDVYFDCELRISYTADIVTEIFGGNNNVWWGFTASTGGLNNEHQVCIDVDSTPDTFTTCDGEPVLLESDLVGESYEWLPDTFLDDNTLETPTSTPMGVPSIEYTLYVYDECGYVTVDDITVEVVTECLTDCPVFNGFDPGNLSHCNGDLVTLNANFEDPSGVTYQWILPDGSSSTEVNPSFTVLTNDNCKESMPISYTFLCTDDNSIIEQGTVDLEVYAPITFIPQATDCQININSFCPDHFIEWSDIDNGVIGEGASFIAEDGSTGTVEFAISHPGAPADCQIIFYETEYDCEGAGACPMLQDVTLDGDVLCEGDELNMAAMLNSPSEGYAIWYLSDGSTSMALSHSITVASATGCTEEQTIEYEVYCVTDDSLLGSGSLSYFVRPVVDATIQGTGCTIVLDFLDCPEFELGYVVTMFGEYDNYYVGSDYVADPGTSGTVIFEVINNDPDTSPECQTFEFEGPFNCEATPTCPGFNGVDLSSNFVCVEETVELQALVEDETQASIIWTFPDGSTDNSFTSQYLANTDFVCNELQQISYEIVCLLDGSVIVSDYVEITVNPEVSFSFVEGDCSIEIIPACDYYTTSYFDPANPEIVGTDLFVAFNPNESGLLQVTVAFEDGPADCNSQSMSIPYNCAAACPQLQSANLSADAVCDGDVLTMTASLDATTAGYVIWTLSDGTTANALSHSIATSTVSGCTEEQTINYAAYCTADDSLIESGSLSYSVMPIASGNIVGDACTLMLDYIDCPEFEASYFLGLPGEDDILYVGNEYTAVPGSSGLITFILWNGQLNTDEECQMFEFPGSYDCAALPTCPVFEDVSISNSEVCVGETVDLLAVLDDQSQASISWTFPDGSSSNNFSSQFEAVTDSDCGELQEVSYQILCNLDGSVIAEGAIELSVYPVASYEYIATLCSVEFSVPCDEFIVSYADPNNPEIDGFGLLAEFEPGQSGTLFMNVTHLASPPGCSTQTLSIPYDCYDICPQLLSAGLDVNNVCEGESITATATLNNPALGYVQWTLPNGNAVTDFTVSYSPVSVSGCTEVQSISYTIYCSDDDSVIESGYLDFLISPAMDASIQDGACTVSLSGIDCPDYQASYEVIFEDGTMESGTGNSYVAGGGSIGAIVFTLVNDHFDANISCNTQTLNGSFNCPANCPAYGGVSASATTICNGETISLEAQIEEASAASILWQFPDGTSSAEWTSSYTALTNDFCQEQQQITYLVTCLEDGSVLDNGILDLTVYAPITILNESDECSLQISSFCGAHTASYVSMDDPSINGTGFAANPPSGSAGTMAFTIAHPGAPADCVEFVFEVDYACAGCPSTDDEDTEQYLCESQVPTQPIVELTDDNGESITWYSDISDINNPTGVLDWSQAITYPDTGDACTPVALEYFATTLCEVDGSGELQVISLNLKHTLHIYPPMLVNLSEADCQIGLSNYCANHAISYEVNSTGPSDGSTGNSDSVSLQAGETGSVTLTLTDTDPNRPVTCGTLQLIGNFDCPIPTCPFTADVPDNLYLCEQEPVSLPVLSISDDNGQSPLWFTDLSDPANPQGPFVDQQIPTEPLDWDGCSSFEQTIYAFIPCDTEGNGDFELQSLGYALNVEVFPTVDATLDTDSCSTTVVANCDYDISYSFTGGYLDGTTGTGNTATTDGGDATLVQFTITSTLANHPAVCASLQLQDNLDCPEAECPSTSSSSSESYLCDGDDISFPELVLINDIGSPVHWYAGFTGVDPIDQYWEGDVLEYDPGLDGCQRDSLVLYAYLACDPDGDQQTGFEWIDLGVTHTYYIYPMLNANTVENICSASIESSCDIAVEYLVSSDGENDLASGQASDFSFVENETGSVTFTVRPADENHPDACGFLEFTVPISCPSCIPAADPQGDDVNICEGEALQSLSVLDNGDTYIWSSDAALADTLHIGAEYLPSGPGSFFVTAYSALDSCASQNSLEIALISNPYTYSSFIYGSDSFCIEDGVITAAVQGTPGGVFSIDQEIQIDENTGAIDLSNSTANTEYTVTYTSPGPCPNSSEFSFSVYTSPDAQLLVPEEICVGEDIVLTIESSTPYTFVSYVVSGTTFLTEGDNFGEWLVANPAQAGVIVIDFVLAQEDCQGTYSTSIEVVGLDIEASSSGSIFPGQSSTLSTVDNSGYTGDISYTWTPAEGLSCTDCPAPAAAPAESTSYTVVASSDAGCIDTATVFVEVFNSFKLNIPNAFSPNADGINDLFKPLGVGIEQVTLFAVYDRWGKLLHSEENFAPGNAVGWDGSYKGELMDLGTYVYYGQVVYLDGSVEDFSGNVTLVR